MKLTDDEKVREENLINQDHFNEVERDKMEQVKTSGHEKQILKLIRGEGFEGGETTNDDQTQSRKNCLDGATNEKKVKEGKKNEDTEINVNMNKEEPKLVRQLTEELANLRFDRGKDEKNGKDTDVKKDKAGCPKPLHKSSSLDGVEKKNADCKSHVDDITACLQEMALESKMKEKSKQSGDKDIVLIAKKADFISKEADARTIQEGKDIPEKERPEKETVVIVAQPEKKGEENEDFAVTRLLSDADSEHNLSGSCMSFISRGPVNGIPKCNVNRDSEDCAQPNKYSRPSGELMTYNHMCGGFVQVVQPNIQPTSLFDLRHWEDMNIASTALQYEKINQSGIVPFASELNFDPRLSHANWPVMQQPSMYCGPPGNEYLLPGEIGDFDEFSMSQRLINQRVDGYLPCGFSEPSSPNGLHMNSQVSSCSPYDQVVLASPGSSPPSYANSPYSTSSILTTDCDFATSPESGIDLTESLDLTLALEYVLEHSNDGGAPPIPEMVEFCNTRVDPTDGTVLPSSGRSYPVLTSTNKPKHTKKTQNKQSKKPLSKQQPRILPPVAGDNIPSGTVLQPPGVCLQSAPTTFQIPCVLLEPSGVVSGKRKNHPVPIQPRPPAENSTPAVHQTSQSNAQLNVMPTFTPPSYAQSPSQEPVVTSSSEQDQWVKAYRWVAGLTKDRLVVQDDDGDTILHLTIVKEEKKLVKALLERYTREGLIDKVINLANKQHQTPICLAVFLNQTDIVKMLIERKADVNVQLQRKLNCGLMCYRLLHYTAKRGRQWVPTLVELLSAENIDLHAFDSDGCTAMHCAIKDHGETRNGSEKINSTDTIYHLAKHGADMNHQHGLSGKTPLHYAIEKKDSDLVGWFLGLALHIQSSGTKPSANGSSPQNLMHSIVNAKPSGGITALQLALNIQMDQEERVKILELLLKYGAEVSQRSCDGKLRQELTKYPKLAPLLKNGTSALKNAR